MNYNWIDQYIFTSEYDLTDEEVLRQTWVISYGNVLQNHQVLQEVGAMPTPNDKYLILIQPFYGDIEYPDEMPSIDPDTITPENIGHLDPERPDNIDVHENPVAWFLLQTDQQLEATLHYCKYFIARHGYLPPYQTEVHRVIDMHSMGRWITQLYFQQN